MEVVLLMTDAQLSPYVPAYGHRLQIMQYCQRHTVDDIGSRLTAVVSKINSSRKRKKHPTGNTNAVAKTRTVQLGWMHSEMGMLTYIVIIL